MLKQRIMTALILLPLVIAVFFFVPLNYFLYPMILLIYFMALEWAKLTGFKSSISISFFAFGTSAINVAVLILSNVEFWHSLSWPNRLFLEPHILVLFTASFSIVISLFIVLTYSYSVSWWSNKVIKSLLGIALLSGFFVALVSIKAVYAFENVLIAGKFLLLMFMIIWSADTGAYFVGKQFGKHALAAKLSPNKTWEGAVGGVLLSLLVAWLGGIYLSIQFENIVLYFAVVFVLAVLSVFGDLFESALKREADVKDSGHLLPGHGGLLDRLDSSIVVAPVYFVSFSYFGWF